MSWGTVISLAAGAATTWYSGKEGKKAAREASKLSPEQQKLMELLVEGSKNNFMFGDFLHELSRGPIVQNTQYLNAASGGDRNTMLRMLNPELTGMSEGAQQAVQTMSQLTPRSGASAEFLAQQPYQLAADQQRLISGAKQNARDQLGQWGLNLANIGANMQSQGQTGALNLMNHDRQRMWDAYNIGNQTAAGMYQTIMGLYNQFYGAGKDAGWWGGSQSVSGPATGSAAGKIGSNPSRYGGYGTGSNK